MFNKVISSFVGLVVQAESAFYYPPEVSVSTGVAAAGITHLCLSKLSESTKSLMRVLGMTLLLNQGVSAMPANDQHELTSSVAQPYIGGEVELPISPAKSYALEFNNENIEIDDFMTQYGDELLTVFESVKPITVFESVKPNPDEQVNLMPGWTFLGGGVSKIVFVHDSLPNYVFKIEYSDYRNAGILKSKKIAQALKKYKEWYQLDRLKIPESILITEISGKPVTIQVEEYIEFEADTSISFDDIRSKLYAFGLCDLHFKNLGQVKGENSIAIVDLDCDIYAYLNEIDREFLIAFSSNNLDQVRISLTSGADINVKGEDGSTALMQAAERGNLEMVQFLFEKGADIHAKDGSGDKALMKAVRKGNLEMVQVLLENGADIDAKNIIEYTALMYTARAGNLEMVQVLFENGADINAKDMLGETALMEAAVKGNLEMVQVLLENGADIDAKDDSGKTALMKATWCGNLDVVQLLLENEADIDAKDVDEYTGLMRVARYGNLEMVQLLLEKGVDIDAKNRFGETALMMAAEKGNLEIVEFLLEKGADIHAKDESGKTALMFAKEYGRFDVIQVLNDFRKS